MQISDDQPLRGIKLERPDPVCKLARFDQGRAEVATEAAVRHVVIVPGWVLAVVAVLVGAFVFTFGDIGALVLGLIGAAIWIIRPQWLLNPSVAATEEPPLGEPPAPPSPSGALEAELAWRVGVTAYEITRVEGGANVSYRTVEDIARRAALASPPSRRVPCLTACDTPTARGKPLESEQARGSLESARPS